MTDQGLVDLLLTMICQIITPKIDTNKIHQTTQKMNGSIATLTDPLIEKLVIPLRHQVLRPGRPLADCYFPEDNSTNAFHAVGLIDNQPAVVASFHPEKFTTHICHNPYRLRGMAVASHWQNFGLGEQLLQYCFDELTRRHCDLLWCNARQRAFSFYQRLGFVAHGELFDIPLVGPHKVLYKLLA